MNDEVEVEVCVFRPNQGDEIEVELTVPATAAGPGRRLRVALDPAAFALALTGRGGIRGRLRETTFGKPKRKGCA